MTITLNDQLAKMKEQFIAAKPLAAHQTLFRVIEEQMKSGLLTGLPVGAKAKDFALTDALGHQVSLYEELSKGPVVLTFYRGGWCPFCNVQLRAYEKILPQIRELGAQLIAISPQSPDHTLTQQEKEQLSFHVLSDTHGMTAARYSLLFDVPDDMRQVLESFGLNLAEYNQTDRWILPVPATFMIDESAVVRFSYVNPDFMKRLEPQEMLAELRKI